MTPTTTPTPEELSIARRFPFDPAAPRQIDAAEYFEAMPADRRDARALLAEARAGGYEPSWAYRVLTPQERLEERLAAMDARHAAQEARIAELESALARHIARGAV